MIATMARGRGALIASLAALTLAAGLTADAASARITVKTTAAKSGKTSRLTVSIANSGKFTSRTKPRAVSVKYKRKTYKLSHVAGSAAAGAAASSTSVWRTSASSAFNGLVGKRVSVTVRTQAKTTTYAQKVAQAPTGPGVVPGPFTPQPPAPGTADPTTRFLNMFRNSGWDRPYTVNAISYEDLYNFCADGRYFKRFTSGQTGTDYPSGGTWQLVGVATGTIAGYNVVEGRVTLSQTQPDAQAPKDVFVDLSEQVPNTAFIDQSEFTRVATLAC